MKSFLKYTLASMLGGFLLIGLMIGIIAALASPSDEKVELEEGSIFKLTLDGPIADRSVDNPLENFNFMTGESTAPQGLYDILRAIKVAGEREEVEGLVLEFGFMQAGMATRREIRNALLDFKSTGKYIYAYAQNYTQGNYYVASVADSIFIHPLGIVEWKGLSSQVGFVVDLLDKLGVEPQVFRYGKFKGAVEPFLRRDLSDENREQMMTYMGSIWGTMVDEVSESRGYSSDQLNNWADELAMIKRDVALQTGFVDVGMYEDEWRAFMLEKAGEEEWDDMAWVDLDEMIEVVEDDESISTDKIAVIFAQGEIVDAAGGSGGGIVGEVYAKAVRKARLDDKVKAIVLRVNSPGGSGFASDLIARELNLAAAAKPLVISQGDLAASGGYYLSFPGDTVLCDPTTITGSIGVFGLLFNPNALLTEKLGLHFDGVSTNAHSDFPDATRGMNEFEGAIIQEQVNDFYEDFVNKVAEGRSMSFEEVDAIAQGRVWAGANAIEIGLTDGFGGLMDAIAIAADRAGLEEYRITELPRQKNPIEEIIGELTGEDMQPDEAFLRSWGMEVNSYREMKAILQHPSRIQARLPYILEIQ